MKSGKLNLAELFTGDRLFYIPDYQRKYAWEKKQLQDFFDDFKSNYNGINKNYYFGTILLQRKKADKEKYDIVDGQQRLTTLIIFVHCLLERMNAITDKDDDFDEAIFAKMKDGFVFNNPNFILSLQNDDDDFFHTKILKDELCSPDFKTPSQRRLLNAKELFEKWLENMNGKDVLAFVNKINTTNVLVYQVNSRSEASLIFETTNDRGKQLTDLEKTKSYLMYKASLLDDSEQLLSAIQNRFNQIYQDCATLEKHQIGEDSVLQYTFIAYEEWHNNREEKAYQHCVEYMKKKSEDLMAQGKTDEFRAYANCYTKNLTESFSTIKEMFARGYGEFKDLLALGIMYNFYPLLIKTFKFDSTENKVSFGKLCRLLEIFVFRIYSIRKFFSNKFQSKWFDLAKRFNGNFDELGNSVINLIKDDGLGGDEAFIADLTDKDFYNKHTATVRNYFFWKYENYLRAQKQPVASAMSHEDLKSASSKGKLTIEHIVARKNTNEQSRIVADDSVVAVGRGDKFNKEYLNAIGNLTIDPQSANSSKGKKDFEEKNSKYFRKAPYKCQNELEDFMVDGKWKIESHEKRTEALIKFAKFTWCDYDKYYVPSSGSTNVKDTDDEGNADGESSVSNEE